MAFPTTSILDNFNRADGDVGSNWGAPAWIDTVRLAISTNQVQFNDAGGGGYYNVSTYGPDSEVYITITTLSGSLELYLRLDTPGAAANGYRLRFRSAFAQLLYYRLDGGVATQLGATDTLTLSSGDSVGGDMVGSTLTAYTNQGAWGSISTRTDTTYTAAGYIGIDGSATAMLADNFGGGTIGAAPPATPGPALVVVYSPLRLG
jgi:hypothetical protein